jgi:hypothetical protein
MQKHPRARSCVLAVAILCAFGSNIDLRAAESRFEKLSEHCYVLPEGASVTAVVTDDGILLINPPDEPELNAAMDALKRLSQKPVRWMVATDYRFALSRGTAYFGEHGAVMLTSKEQAEILSALPEAAPASVERLVFDSQMRMFPGGVEVRIFGVKQKAHTGGDVVAFLPFEKVVAVGDLYTAGTYPDIDADPGRGDALGWLAGMKQVIDSIPLLKPAITPPKPEVKPGVTPPKPEIPPEEEKTLEQLMLVISSYGAPSDLQQMKDLLGMAQKLKERVAWIVSRKQPCESFIDSAEAFEFQAYGNFASYTAALCAALSGQPQTR